MTEPVNRFQPPLVNTGQLIAEIIAADDLVINTDEHRPVVGDGVTIGGIPVAKQSEIPAAATDADVTTGAGTTVLGYTPAQLKLGVTTFGGAQLVTSGGNAGTATTAARSDHVHALTIGNGSATQVSLTTSDRLDIVSGSGSTVSYDDTNNKVTISADLAASGGDAGTATTIARSDHAHSSYVNPTAATDTEITTGTGTSVRGYTPAQIKLGAQTFGGAQLVTSGGNAGTATTAARSDHLHANATTSAAGFLSSTDKTKIDGLSAAGEYVLAEFNPGNNNVALTTMASTTVRNGLGGNALRSVNLAGINTINFRVLVANVGATAARLALIYATNPSSPSWLFMDGVTAAPADGTAAISSSLDATYGAIDISTTGYKKVSIALPAALKTAAASGEILLNVIRWGGNGTTTANVVAARITTNGTGLSSGVGVSTTRVLTAGTGLTGGGDLSADRTLAIDLDAENIRIDQRAKWFGPNPLIKAPVTTGLVGIKRAQRIDVTSTTQAGSAYAVTRSDASGTVSNCKTKLRYLAQNFGKGGGVLYFPPSSASDPNADAYCLDGPINLGDYVVIEGRDGYEQETIIRNYRAFSVYSGTCVYFGNVQNSTWFTSFTHTWRTCADIVAGQDYLVATNTTQLSGISIGDQILIATPQYYHDNTYDKPFRAMYNYVTAINGTRVMLMWPVPWDVTTLSSSVTAPGYSTTRAPVFCRTADIATGSGDFGTAGRAVCPRNTIIRNITLRSDNSQVMATGMPLLGEWSKVIVKPGTTEIKSLYGNLMQWTKMEDIDLYGDCAAIEWSICSFGNKLRNVRFELYDDYTTASTQAIDNVLITMQELSSDNEIDGFVMAGAKKWAPTNSPPILKNTGQNNTFRNFELTMDVNGGQPFVNDQQSTDIATKGESWPLSGSVYSGITLNYRTAKAGSLLANEVISDHTYEGIRVMQATNSTATLTVPAGSSGVVFRDMSLWNSNIVVSAGATNTEFTRILQHTGSFSDSGTGTITTNRTNAPEFYRYGTSL